MLCVQSQVLAFCGLFDVAMALKEPFGVDASDMDP
jgi:hypothetical protein